MIASIFTTGSTATTAFAMSNNVSLRPYATMSQAGISLTLYILAFFLGCWRFKTRYRFDMQQNIIRKNGVVSYPFSLLLTCAFALRVLLIALDMFQTNWPSIVFEIINRLALLACFSAFSYLVALWIDILAYSAWRVIFFVNVALWLWETIIVMARALLFTTTSSGHEHDTKEKSMAGILEMLLLSTAFLCYSMVSLFYGVRLYLMLRRGYSVSVDLTTQPMDSLQQDERARSIGKKLILVTLLSSFAFALRFSMFVYFPITGKYFTGTLGWILYPYCFYEIPDLVPGVLILWITGPSQSDTNSQQLDTNGDQLDQPLDLPHERLNEDADRVELHSASPQSHD